MDDAPRPPRPTLTRRTLTRAAALGAASLWFPTVGRADVTDLVARVRVRRPRPETLDVTLWVENRGPRGIEVAPHDLRLVGTGRLDGLSLRLRTEPGRPLSRLGVRRVAPVALLPGRERRVGIYVSPWPEALEASPRDLLTLRCVGTALDGLTVEGALG